jgi:hypothetical protein
MPSRVRSFVLRRFAAASVLVALALRASAADSTPAAAPVPVVELKLPAAKAVAVTAPVELFNGRNLDGWTYLAAGQPADIATVCSVKDGVMAVTGVPGRSTGFLLLPEVRENYRLHLEWRWTAAVTASTNGGILLHVTPGPLQQGLWPISFQAQLKATRAGDFIAMSTAIAAEAAPGATASRQKDASEKPAGEWNAADIVVRGNTIECTINGVVQAKLTECFPAFGRIGFQLEGHPFELRALRLARL